MQDISTFKTYINSLRSGQKSSIDRWTTGRSKRKTMGKDENVRHLLWFTWRSLIFPVIAPKNLLINIEGFDDPQQTLDMHNFVCHIVLSSLTGPS